MTLIEVGLRLAGMPEATIQELNAKLPALTRIAEAVKEIEPTITKIWPDVVAVTPLIQDLIAFAKDKETLI